MSEIQHEPTDGTPLPHRRVLIVDDHAMFASSLSLALAMEPDLEVVGVSTTLAAARRALATLSPDVVLLDHRLPDGRGVEAIGELRQINPDAQLVVLTASLEESLAVAATEAGAAGFLVKTSTVEELVAAVRAAAAGEMLISPSVLGRLLERLRGGGRPQPASPLTEREQEILGLIAEGLSNQAIADRLVLSVNTVRNHVANVLAKLDAHSKLEALSIALREGYLDPPRD